MADYIYVYLTSLGVMTAIDAVWLGLVAPKFYKKHIGYIMTDMPIWLSAIIFYLIFILGVAVFVVYPGWRNSESLTKIALQGALLGLVSYATYDLTNQATLKGWPFIVTAVDLMWGTFLTALVSVVSVLVLKKFLN